MTRIVTVLGIVLLAGSVGATAWWFNQPGPPPAAGLDPALADVFCTGRVDAAGQVAALEPSQPGRVAKVCVAEGDVVSAGTEILRLDDSAAVIRLAQADVAVEAARIELDAAKAEKERFGKLVEAKEHLIAAAAARVEAARKLLEQRREQRSVTPLGKAEEKAAEAQVQELEQLEAAERKQLDDAKDREARGLGTDLKVRAAEARLKAAEADRRLTAKAVSDCVLTAPTPGTVLRLQAAAGGVIAPGSPVPAVVFAPAGPLVVRAEIDQESLGRVQPGQPAEVQDENHPDGPVWKGRVKQVARWVAGRRTFVLEPGELNDVRTLECVIELDGPTDRLVIGQRMRVRILRPDGPPPNGSAGAVR